MDFSKAFDNVPHQRLLKKLHHSGITGSLLSWMENFLTRRTQRVVLDGVTSDSVYVSSGVPQGTVLGPAMFLLYIDDLPRKINSTVRLLADDCIMYKRITTQADNNILQQDIDTLCFWQNQWLMKFNTKKCFSMTITHKLTPATFTYDMGGVPLQSTDSHTYLGVLLNSKLNWNQHINKTTTKANKTLGLLRRNFHHCSTSVKSTTYKTLVCPQLEYCCTIWDPHHQTSIDRIEAVQNRAARFSLLDYSRESGVTSMKYNLEWDLLEERIRLRAHLLLLYKAANQTAAIDITKFIPDNDQTHRYRTRQTSTTSYKRIPAQNDCYKFSFLPRTTAQWNSLPASVRQSPTIDALKHQLNSSNLLQLTRGALRR